MQIQIELKVTFEGGFNIGAGSMGGSLSRRPLLLDWRGLPYIPASSFKGRLRHTCKQLAEALGKKTCNEPQADVMCPNGPEKGEFCPVCNLFGSAAKPSNLIFTDLSLTEPAFLSERLASLPTSLRYGVGLSRRRRVAEDNLLFDTEVFLPGGPVSFSGEIQGDIEPENLKDLGLLVAGLEQLRSLGNSKTAGLGWCNVTFEIHQPELSRAEIKKGWLG